MQYLLLLLFVQQGQQCMQWPLQVAASSPVLLPNESQHRFLGDSRMRKLIGISFARLRNKHHREDVKHSTVALADNILCWVCRSLDLLLSPRHL